MRVQFTFALLVALSLGGCLGDDQADADADVQGTAPEPEPERPRLHGWVLDETIRPLAGVRVEVLEVGVNTTTDAHGFYGFDSLPTNEALILVATAEAYKTKSQQVTLHPDVPVRLNFTMVAVPKATPFHEVDSFNGILSCQVSLVLAEDDHTNDCSAGDPGDIWEFAVSPGLAGLVLEVAWEASNELSASLQATLETLGLGDQNQLLAEAVGTSILRLQVPEDTAAKLYPAGGQMRLTVRVLPNTDENEAGAGVGLAVNQEFQAFASAFYVEPPPPTYSIAG